MSCKQRRTGIESTRRSKICLGGADRAAPRLDPRRKKSHLPVIGICPACRIDPPLRLGEIAARLGEPGAARDVGAALGHNPFAIVVPCHRVVAANGKLGGFSARGGIKTKLRLLSIEGVQAPGTVPLFERGPLAR